MFFIILKTAKMRVTVGKYFQIIKATPGANASMRRAGCHCAHKIIERAYNKIGFIFSPPVEKINHALAIFFGRNAQIGGFFCSRRTHNKQRINLDV